VTEPVITGTKDMRIEDCARLTEQYQIRRLPIVDANGACCGMVAVADLATKASRDLTAEVVGTASEPTATASVVAGL
jgi:Mg/Co/Ni transporter MgtE